MPRQQIVKCAACGHNRTLHTSRPVKPCAKRMPVAWRGTGRNRQPVIGYCPCDKYEPPEEQ